MISSDFWRLFGIFLAIFSIFLIFAAIFVQKINRQRTFNQIRLRSKTFWLIGKPLYHQFLEQYEGQDITQIPIKYLIGDLIYTAKIFYLADVLLEKTDEDREIIIHYGALMRDIRKEIERRFEAEAKEK